MSVVDRYAMISCPRLSIISRSTEVAGRRPNGSSSIFLGADGRWHGWVSMGRGSATQRNRRHVSAATRSAVMAKVRDLEHLRDSQRLAAGGPMTVASWMEYWLANIAAVRVRPRTLESYRSLVQRHITPVIGNRPLDAVRPEHLEQLYAALLGNGLSANSVLR